jgi:hypothetical protein
VKIPLLAAKLSSPDPPFLKRFENTRELRKMVQFIVILLYEELDNTNSAILAS